MQRTLTMVGVPKVVQAAVSGASRRTSVGAPEWITYNGNNSAESVGSVLDPTLPSQSQTGGNRKYPPTTTVGLPSQEDQTLEKLQHHRAR